MTTIFRYKRVAVEPGKHGENDRRVTFNGTAPTAGEVVAMVAGLLEAEDRYSGKHHHGRDLFYSYLRSAYHSALELGELCRLADDKEANGRRVA